MNKKSNKIYEKHELNFSINVTSRKSLRNQAINKFLEEERGYWKDGVQYVTSYKYFVENTADGKRVYLLRPTFLNKGIDFQVWVEKIDGSNDKRPSHKDVFEDLRIKRKENLNHFPLLLKAINRVWNCENIDTILADIKLEFKKGFSVELLLKILKWLFIEQDITYWNYDGRAMLGNGINEEFK